MAMLPGDALKRKQEEAEEAGLTETQVHALYCGCPRHGNAGMFWEGGDLICGPCLWGVAYVALPEWLGPAGSASS